jgi:hypothetical protein
MSVSVSLRLLQLVSRRMPTRSGRFVHLQICAPTWESPDYFGATSPKASGLSG